MIKRLVLALSRVPGLGWLRRLVGDAVDEPRELPEAELPETELPEAELPEAELPEARPRPEAKRSEARPRPEAVRSEAVRPEAKRSEARPRPEAKRPEAVRSEAKPPEARPRPEAKRPEAAPSAGRAPGASTRAPVAVAVAESPGGAGSRREAEPAAEFRQAPRTEPGRRAAPATTPPGQGLGLAAIDPGRAFAFWEIPAQAIRRARQYLRERNGREQAVSVVLRVHDVTRVEFDGSNGRRTMDLPAGQGDDVAGLGERTPSQSAGTIKGRLYVDLWTDDLDAPGPSRIFCELGVRTASGEFIAVAWSPILDLPTVEDAARDPLVRAAVIGEPDRWRPRLAPRRPASSQPALAGAESAASRADHPWTTTVPPRASREIRELLEGRAAAERETDPTSVGQRTPSPALSSAEVLRRREHARRPAGISSGLVARRRT